MNYQYAKILDIKGKIYFLYQDDDENYKIIESTADVLRSIAHISVEHDIETLYFDDIETLKLQFEIA